MPNYIKNKLEIMGTKDQVAEIKNFLKGEPGKDGMERLVDFNKILKCPEAIEEVGEISQGIVYAVKNKYDLPFDEDELVARLEMIARKRQELNPFKKKEDIIAFEKACSAFETTGYIYWRDWNLVNWGTKWNAFSFEYETPGNTLIWETADSAVLTLMLRLSERFPRVKFAFKWAEDHIGRNCGRAKIQKGKANLYIPGACSPEAYEIAIELWPGARQ